MILAVLIPALGLTLLGVILWWREREQVKRILENMSEEDKALLELLHRET